MFGRSQTVLTPGLIMGSQFCFWDIQTGSIPLIVPDLLYLSPPQPSRAGKYGQHFGKDSYGLGQFEEGRLYPIIPSNPLGPDSPAQNVVIYLAPRQFSY